MSNARAELLLTKAGIPFEPEPRWIKEGQKPDFYCKGKQPFWCEVKTLERPDDSEKLSSAFHDLRNRTANIEQTGQGIAYIHDDFSERDAKNVVQLLKRGLKRFEDGDSPDIIVALVPRDPDRKQFVRFSVATGSHGTAEFHSCVSRTGSYGSPDGIFANPFGQQVTQHFSTGTKRTAVAGAFLHPNETFLVAIVVWRHSDRFALISAASALPAKRLKNSQRIREVLSDANDQFKNGMKYKDAPCLLTIFHDGLDVPDETIIKSALYGNLKFVFPKGRPEKGKLIFDKDGGWTPEKNRTTSAILYVRNDGQPLLVHNYWARKPFPTGRFDCKEVSLLPKGTFQETDIVKRPISPSILTRIAGFLGKLWKAKLKR
ncbi:hypothetical protein [Bradyrhizobium sp. CIR3A]|uniref:hypothetical protein n=1 Tax=Bradyrhizobium sp. CIR3A TaxID=2663838 RepID=UPI001605D7AC|nr:hypothetical protein [Bradyrhizobium sp. CIR3A]MBB4263565.1 hypothetical protein [Bradyrhizobium sp. CIR3A]